MTSNPECQQSTQDILDQKSKFLSFEELCLEWSNYITKVGGIENILNNKYMMKFIGTNQKKYDLLDTGRCIVGEAHRGDAYTKVDLDWCKECCDFSVSFVGNNKIAKYKITNEKSFEKVKNLFINHFNEVHLQ